MTTESVPAIAELLSVNSTSAAEFKAAPYVVMTPACAFNVTAVVALVACVTAPTSATLSAEEAATRSLSSKFYFKPSNVCCFFIAILFLHFMFGS